MVLYCILYEIINMPMYLSTAETAEVDMLAGKAMPDSEMKKALSTFLMDKFSALRQAHNWSDRCVEDVISFCKWLQEFTATVRLKLPDAMLSPLAAMPAQLLSYWKSKETAKHDNEEVWHLLRSVSGA